MKNKIFIVLLCVVFFSTFKPNSGQGAESMKGYEFWLGFFNNNLSTESNDLMVIITSESDVEGKVSIPKTNWSQDFKISAGSSYSIKIPTQLVNHKISDQIENKGIKILATGRVSVFALNSSLYTTDGTIILPKQNLGRNYWVMTYPGFNDNPNELLIVATEDDTHIEITPSTKTENGHPANIPFKIILNSGQSYLLRAKARVNNNNDSGDLTGTRVSGVGNCNPFAVYSGAKGAHIPFDCSAVDHIFHQMLPDNCLGNTYILSPINNEYSCRILATEENTVVKLDGTPHITIQKGQFITIHYKKEALVIEGNHPLVVAQFLQGTMCSEGGDPGMAIVAPITKRYNKVQISKANASNIEKEFVEIITKIDNGNRIRLNGALVTGLKPFASIPEYGFMKFELPPGTSFLEADSGMVAMTYGIGYANSFLSSSGYQAEMGLEVNINKGLCLGSTATFNCAIEGASTCIWDFGDKNSGKGNSVSHNYDKPGEYKITLTVFSNNECPTVFTDLIKVTAYPLLDLPKEVTACGDQEIILSAKEPGLVYNWSTGEQTQSISAKNSGIYILEATNNICSSLDTVLVTRTPYPHIVEISADTTIFMNTRAQLKSSGGTSYQWSPPDGLSCTNCPDPVSTPLRSTTYYVKIFDDDGCLALDSVVVNVELEFRVFVPNIFSPNNDGQNDILYVRGKGVSNLKFLVYDRWGKKIFESFSLENGWDGTYKGTPLPPSVFVYYVEATLITGELIIQKGDVTIIK